MRHRTRQYAARHYQPWPRAVVIAQEEKRYPGIGLLLCLVTGLAFWGMVAYLVCR